MIGSITVDNQAIELKFDQTIKVSSLTNDKFTLTQGVATPVVVANPFRLINLSEDYNSISRMLWLYFAFTQQTGQQYTLKVSGLVDVAGKSVPDFTYTFTSSAPGEGSDVVELPPSFSPVQVVDYTIVSRMYDEDHASGDFYVVQTDPNDPYILSDQNNGRLAIEFNQPPDPLYVTDEYIKVQRKKIQRAPGRWEPVEVTFERDGSCVYIQFSEAGVTDDATPKPIYFQGGYKYRIKVSKEVRAGVLAVVPEPADIGATSMQDIDLNIAEDETTEFDIIWLEEDGVTPIAMDASSIEASIKTYPGGPVVLDLEPLTVVTGHIAHITITPAATSALDSFSRGVWLFRATALLSGERKTLVSGDAIYQRGI